MKLIIGMAKSNLSLKDCQSRKLELDFLRLAYTVQRVEVVKKGYLMVTTEKIKKRTEKWKEKYQLDGEVEVLVAKLAMVTLTPITTPKKATSRPVICQPVKPRRLFAAPAMPILPAR